MIPSHPDSEFKYVRYLLTYRLWKKVNSDMNKKNQINANAISTLGVPPANIPTFLLEEVLPPGPSSTKFYLLQKFDVPKSCNLFLQFCRRSRGFESENKTADKERRVCIYLLFLQVFS